MKNLAKLAKIMAVPIIAATLFAPSCKFAPQPCIYGNINCSINNPNNSQPHNVYIVITEGSGLHIPNGTYTIPSVKLPSLYSLNLPKEGQYRAFAEWDINDDGYLSCNPDGDSISYYPFIFSVSDESRKEIDFNFN